jgi:hypothetical protein
MTKTVPKVVTIVLTRDLDMNWRGQKIKGPAGSLFDVTDAERFIAEFAGRTDDLVILSEGEAWEMRQAEEKERHRVRAEQAETERVRLIEAEADAERQARHDALIELVRAGVRTEAER